METSVSAAKNRRGLIVFSATLSIFVLTLIAAGLALYFNFNSLAKSIATGLTVEAGKYVVESPAKQELLLLTALKLDPGNQRATIAEAELMLSRGEIAAALKLLGPVQSLEAARLRLHYYAEQGSATEAGAAARYLAENSQNSADQLLAGLVLSEISDTDMIDALITRMSDSKASQRLINAKTNMLSLAVELQATGLEKSSQRIFAKVPDSITKSLVQADLLAINDNKTELETARALYANIVASNPADIATREKLATILAKLGDTSAANEQLQLVEKLKSGKL